VVVVVVVVVGVEVALVAVVARVWVRERGVAMCVRVRAWGRQAGWQQRAAARE